MYKGRCDYLKLIIWEDLLQKVVTRLSIHIG